MDNSNDLLIQLQQELANIKKKKEEKYKELEIKRLIESINKEQKKLDKIIDAINTKTSYTKEENKEFISKMNGMPIRHLHKKTNDCWTAVCDGRYIIYNSTIFTSPSAFAKAHIKAIINNNQDYDRKTFEVNGWTSCEVYYSGEWIKLDEFRKLNRS